MADRKGIISSRRTIGGQDGSPQDFCGAFCAELLGVEVVVSALAGDEFGVASAFDDVSVVDDED